MKITGRLLLALVALFVGIFVIIGNQPSATGAVVGLAGSAASHIRIAVGLLFLACSLVLFTAHPSGVEIKVVDLIRNSSRLEKLADEAERNQKVARDLDHLIRELAKGHETPGLGNKYLPGTVGIREERAEHGGRLYFRKKSEGHNIVYEILGESEKGNQQKVIDELRRLYH